jgi:hypothetical protein
LAGAQWCGAGVTAPNGGTVSPLALSPPLAPPPAGVLQHRGPGPTPTRAAVHRLRGPVLVHAAAGACMGAHWRAVCHSFSWSLLPHTTQTHTHDTPCPELAVSGSWLPSPERASPHTHARTSRTHAHPGLAGGGHVHSVAFGDGAGGALPGGSHPGHHYLRCLHLPVVRSTVPTLLSHPQPHMRFWGPPWCLPSPSTACVGACCLACVPCPAHVVAPTVLPGGSCRQRSEHPPPPRTTCTPPTMGPTCC